MIADTSHINNRQEINYLSDEILGKYTLVRKLKSFFLNNLMIKKKINSVLKL